MLKMKINILLFICVLIYALCSATACVHILFFRDSFWVRYIAATVAIAAGIFAWLLICIDQILHKRKVSKRSRVNK
jgi:uncharacterized integral membrane protein